MDGVFSPWHIIVVLVVAAVLFYRGDKLPDMARSVGRSLRVFKTEIKGLAEDDKAREAAGTDTGTAVGTEPAAETGVVHVTKAIEAPTTPDTAPAARVTAVPSEPIAVKAEIIRSDDRQTGARPRPRPASTSRQ